MVVVPLAMARGEREQQQPLPYQSELEGVGIVPFGEEVYTLLAEVEVKTLDGESISLADYDGTLLALNFWATWCLPCVEELPAMQRLQETLMDEPFAVVAVNLQENAESVAAFVQRIGITLPVVLDPRGDRGADFGVRGLPTTFLIGKDGRLIGRAIGIIEWDGEEVVALLRRILAET